MKIVSLAQIYYKEAMQRLTRIPTENFGKSIRSNSKNVKFASHWTIYKRDMVSI